MMTPLRQFANSLAAIVAMTLAANARGAQRDLVDLSLEELMNEPITLVSKRPTRLGDAAAAVTVTTQEEIRRSGVTSLADVLRLTPGMHVARINNHAWAVSARGFQGQFADKLLVMIDGRTIYEPMFGGVHWSVQDVILEDLERIEVIRGPGATLWGANAVNGVINIITKQASDTQGTLTSATMSTQDGPSLTLRYGGHTDSEVDYRVYAKYFDRGGLPTANGSSRNDDWSGARAGFRLDWQSAGEDSYLLEGEIFQGSVTENVTEPVVQPPFAVTRQSSGGETGGNVLGRWSRALSETSQLTLQSFYSHSQFRISGSYVRADTLDLELQHQLAPTPRQTIVWGAGYRVIDDAARQMTTSPDQLTQHLYTGFVQDEISLIPKRLQFTMGVKFEHNQQTGFETQPSVRLAWKPSTEQTAWIAISRAIRTPDRFERGGQASVAIFPRGPGAPLGEVQLAGGGDLKAEELLAYELGYRIEPTSRLAFDIATFYNEYDNVIDFTREVVAFNPDSTPPRLLITQFADNSLAGSGYGAELSLLWNVSERLDISADYTWLRIPLLDVSHEFDSANHLAHVRGHLRLPRQLELTGTVSYTDRLHSKDIDASLQLDLGMIWRPSERIEVGVWGQNLLDQRRTEFNDLHSSVVSEVPRSALLRVISRF